MHTEGVVQKRQILFFDDESDAVEEVVAFLERNGYAVRGVTTPADAIRAFEEEDFDLCIVDFSMSVPADMDEEAVDFGRTVGLEVARRMHAKKPSVPIVALTVVDRKTVSADIKEAGIVGYIEKPVEPAKLCDEIKGLLR